MAVLQHHTAKGVGVGGGRTGKRRGGARQPEYQMQSHSMTMQ